MKPERIVVIGNGMVGQRFLEQLTSRGDGGAFGITGIGAEPGAASGRVQLMSFFACKSAIDLSVVPDGFFVQQAITLRLNDRVFEVDRAKKTLRSSRYREVPYGKLVLATGSD